MVVVFSVSIPRLRLGVDKYKYNTEVDLTRRDLETTKQGPKESFLTFITK